MAPAQSDARPPLFSSRRERRLWAWTLAVVAAIYSTLGLASTLAGVLADHDLLTPVFFLCMFLFGATVLTQGLQVRPRGVEIAVGLGVVAVYLLVSLRILVPAERTHLMEYSVVAVFIHEALRERASQGRRVPLPALLAILVTSLVGAIDECIQAFLPTRVFDPVDILFNVLASVMAVATCVVLGWARYLQGKRSASSADEARRDINHIAVTSDSKHVVSIVSNSLRAWQLDSGLCVAALRLPPRSGPRFDGDGLVMYRELHDRQQSEYRYHLLAP